MTEQYYYDLKQGQTLGRNYHIVEFLGSGWEGEVYKVKERQTNIIRVAKVYYPKRGNHKSPLAKYAKKLYKLRGCPIVVQYIHRDVARIRGEQAEIMISDFVEGEMLSTYISRRPKKRLSEFEALHLLHAIAKGVEPIHQLGEYHGDIHSDNILIKRRGLGYRVFLLDFFDFGYATRDKIKSDVLQMMDLLVEMIGGPGEYSKASSIVKGILRGRKHSLILERFKTAGQLRIRLENLEW